MANTSLHDSRSSLSNIDVDECAMYNGGCEQNCHNTVGSYYCSCNAGYTLNEDGHSCDGTFLLLSIVQADTKRINFRQMLHRGKCTFRTGLLDVYK